MPDPFSDAVPEGPDLFMEAKKGRGAAQLLEEEAFQDGMKGLNDATVQAIRECSIGDQERLNYLHLMLRVIGDFEGNLRTVMETGKLALHSMRAKDATAARRTEVAAQLGIPVADLKEY